MARLKKYQRPERIIGGYSSILWVVIDSVAFKGLTDRAKALLFPLMRQHNGMNNGHLHLAKRWLYEQGYTNDESNRKAKKELIDRGLIVHTKQGGLNMGADLYALTWYAITNYVGLDIKPSEYRQGAYALCALPPTARRKPPARKNPQPAERAGANSTTEPENQITCSYSERIEGVFSTFTGSVYEHNVITPLHTINSYNNNQATSAHALAASGSIH